MQGMMGKLGVIQSSRQQLSCILIGCIFYGMVYKLVVNIRVAWAASKTQILLPAVEKMANTDTLRPVHKPLHNSYNW